MNLDDGRLDGLDGIPEGIGVFLWLIAVGQSYQCDVQSQSVSA